jgi:hypothetical protein
MGKQPTSFQGFMEAQLQYRRYFCLPEDKPCVQLTLVLAPETASRATNCPFPLTEVPAAAANGSGAAEARKQPGGNQFSVAAEAGEKPEGGTDCTAVEAGKQPEGDQFPGAAEAAKKPELVENSEPEGTQPGIENPDGNRDSFSTASKEDPKVSVGDSCVSLFLQYICKT